MVASSVVLTVVVLNYHHRTAETHVMPMWVGELIQNLKLGHISPWFIFYHYLSHLFFLGEVSVSAMDALAVEDEPPGKENHKEKDKYDK